MNEGFRNQLTWNGASLNNSEQRPALLAGDQRDVSWGNGSGITLSLGDTAANATHVLKIALNSNERQRGIVDTPEGNISVAFCGQWDQSVLTPGMTKSNLRSGANSSDSGYRLTTT